MYNIDYNSFRSVKGFNRRVRFLVMHYTASILKILSMHSRGLR